MSSTAPFPEDPLSRFHPVVATWFRETYGEPSPPQRLGWPAIAAGSHTLILAPTGSGKTLASLLWCIDDLTGQGARGALKSGVQVVYVSPLKALNNDIHANLREPLCGIHRTAEQMGIAIPAIEATVRTGDTTARERNAMLRRPPHILITTPESLYLLLTSPAARDMLRTARYVVVDEIHAICGEKRGVHLALSLERLDCLVGHAVQRIGLSATQRPLELIGRFLGGVDPATHEPRPVTIVDAGSRKDVDLLVELPVHDFRSLPGESIWPAIAARLLDLVRSHRSTLIFVNSRRLAERLATRMNDLAGEDLVRTHHGSLSKEVRLDVERDLKAGALRALVATGSLELGIDVGAIDLVVQVESPRSAGRGLQRVGRSGHLLSATSKGRILPKYRNDLLEAVVVARQMLAGEIEPTRVPQNCLDVLAQQIAAMVAVDEWSVPDLLAVVRGAYSYRELTRRQLDSVLQMLAGGYPAEDFAELRPRIVWNRATDRIKALQGTRQLATTSGGTIPDRGYFGVYQTESGVKLGELDEELVFETRIGDVIQLGVSSWRVRKIERDRLLVEDAPGAPARMPFWHGEGIGRPFELGAAIGAVLRELEPRLDDDSAIGWLEERCRADDRAARNLVQYLRDQRARGAEIPSDRRIVVEHFLDELGDHRVAVLSLFGKSVNTAWGLALSNALRGRMGIEVESLANDDGVIFRFPNTSAGPPVDLLSLVRSDNVDAAFVAEMAGSSAFALRFRENATRALLLPRRLPGKRTPLFLQRLRSENLLEVAQRYESFPILVETYRECLEDLYDLPHLRELLGAIERGEVTVVVRQTAVPSPFTATLLFDFVTTYMYRYDTPVAERKTRALSLNRGLLRELLGHEDLRELLDPRAIEDVRGRLSRTADGWRARTADELADHLRTGGDLASDEVSAHVEGDPDPLLRELERERRAVRVVLPGAGLFWVLAEDYAAYRGAFGEGSELAIIPPFDATDSIITDLLPRQLIERMVPADQALVLVLRRRIRAIGPTPGAQLAQRYNVDAGSVEGALRTLAEAGELTPGHFSPGVREEEWISPDALRQVQRRTLALLRAEIEPADPHRHARFLIRWQGLSADRKAIGEAALPGALGCLQGFFLPAEVWERDVLPARIGGFQPGWLDQQSQTGHLVWAGRAGDSAIGGRLAWFVEEDLRALLPSPADNAPSAEGRALLDALTRGGAMHFAPLARASGLDDHEAQSGLWELVWSTRVTNDSFLPVRLGAGATSAQRPARDMLSTPSAHLSARQRYHRAKRYIRPVSVPGGRWSLLPSPDAVLEERVATYLRVLLDRMGVVAREIALAEGPLVPWAAMLQVLREMEWSGEVQSGYFLKELSGPQFALPDAIELLRGSRSPSGDREDAWALLNSCDPANPFGSLYPLERPAWAPPGRISRSASTWLVLREGIPALAIELNGRRLTGLGAPEAPVEQALTFVAHLPTGSAPGFLRRIEVERWNGEPVLGSPIARRLAELGFIREPGRMILWPSLFQRS